MHSPPIADERGGSPKSDHRLPYPSDAAEYNKDSPLASLFADRGGSSSKWSTYCQFVH